MTPDMLEQASRYRQAGDLDKADHLLRRLVEINPTRVDGWFALGNTCLSRDRIEDAVVCYQRALDLVPGHPAILHNLGGAHFRQGRLHEAALCLRRAIQSKPDYARAYNTLGAVLIALGQLAEAETAYRHAVRFQPQYAQAHNNLGLVLSDQKKLDDAVASYDQALRCSPEFAGAYTNRGVALLERGQQEEGLASLRRAVSLHSEGTRDQQRDAGPESALDDQHQLSPGAFRQSARILADQSYIISCYLMYLNYMPGVDPAFVFAEHQKGVGSRFSARDTLATDVPPKTPRRLPTPFSRSAGPLRIGYVSPDLRSHVVAHFLEPILACHDAEQVHVTCYAEVDVPDQVTARLQSLVQRWRPTCGVSDMQAADLIRADEIDILVDLAGHTSGNRLGVFGLKPAPIQVTYLGYPNTTGLPMIDYRLTDAVADPPDEPPRHTEALWRLPKTFCCYQPPGISPEVVSPPVQRKGFLTFGSLHNLARLNGAVLDLWCEILHAAPTARLLVARDTLRGHAREHFLRQFAERGIGEDRLELRAVEHTGANSHLSLYGEIDLSLDTFPWSGHVTACESLWMGVPALTPYGASFAGRMVSSVLTALGLDDFIARSPAEYRDRALQLSADPTRLAELRPQLRGMMQASPLCDAKTFARDLEAVYRDMWVSKCPP